ncbi:MAG: right-handed parallel beta-helix repeat-containing protein, partial [Planctomycetota bacterium]|nr:right-handed parallel beta-helix repeat-containing protein [Planctomycetota bacterium]
MLIRPLLTLALLFALLSGCSTMPHDFHVASTGNDQNPGTQDKPFATFERARDAVRQARREAKQVIAGGNTVWIAGGTYTRTATFELGEADSGSAAGPIVYRAMPGAEVRVMGGRSLATWTPIDDSAVLDRLDPAARTHVLQADLKALGVGELGPMLSRGFARGSQPAGVELFFNQQPMTVARWPNNDWVTIASVPAATAGKDDHGSAMGKLEGGFHFAGDRPKRWAKSDDIWVHGYWAYDWANSYERVDVLDTETHFIKTHEPYGLYGYMARQRFYFLNVLEELDAPGEYYVDRARGRIYFWPPAPIKGAEITASLLDKPLVRLHGASHVVFRGITFECSRAGAVEIHDGSHDLVAGCIFRDLGNAPVVITGGAQHGVRSCDFHHLGDGGVKITGGDRATLVPCNHFVENCHFHHLAIWSRCYHPAVLAQGVGIRVAHNLIHDHPHCAILYQGNDITVEHNEIYRVCNETGDVGAIYTGRDFTARGNHVQYNFIHHTGGVGMGSMAVYLDDCVSGQEILGNVFYKTQRAAFIGGGRDNHTVNNLFVECQPAVMIDGRGVSPAPVWHNMVFDFMRKLYDKAKPHEPPYSTRYPDLTQLDPLFAAGVGVPPTGTQVLRNISVGGQWLVIHWGAEKKDVEDRDNLVTADPGFVDADYAHSLDFRLRDDSPAFKHGFVRIPTEKIGLEIDQDRVARPRVLSRLDVVPDPKEPLGAIVRLTVRNTGETRWAGRVEIHAKPVNRAAWAGGKPPVFDCALAPGQSATQEFRCGMVPGSMQFEAGSDAPGLRPTWQPFNPPQPVKRVSSGIAPDAAPTALKGQPAWPI